MDVIEQFLSLTPVPYLAPAVALLNFIWSTVQQVQASKGQLLVLTSYISQLLCTLNAEYHANRLLGTKTAISLDDLCKYEFTDSN